MHRQRQYVANTSVNFSDFHFFVKPGDLCRHHEDTGDFIIFRNGELLAKLKISPMALKGMMTTETQFFTEIKAATPSEAKIVSPPVVHSPLITIIDETEEETISINTNVEEVKEVPSRNIHDTPPPFIGDPIEEEEEVEEESTDDVGVVTVIKKKRKK